MGGTMKRLRGIIIFIFLLILFVFLTDLIKSWRANDDNIVDGSIFNKEGEIYLITDDDFSLEEAEQLSMEQLFFNYGGIYILNKQGNTEHGDKVRIWHSFPVLESHPAGLRVLKIKKVY